MKISIALTALILAVGAVIGWQDHRHLISAGETHSKLVSEAGKLGIAVDSANPAAAPHVTKRERENREVSAKDTAADLIAFAKEMEAMEKSGKGRPDEGMQKRILDLMDKMMALDAGQIKILIAELRACTDLKDETRQNIIGFSIMTLANDHPQAALALFTESGDLMKDNRMGGHVVSSALARWAKDDPAGALEWVRKNAETHPDLVTDEAKRGIIKGAAANDPKLAFKLIGELGLKQSSQAISDIVGAAKTPEERTASLGAIREYLATLTDEAALKEAGRSASSALARGLGSEGFESATKWLESSKLTPEELEAVSSGLPHNVKSADTGKWIEWLGAKLPPEKMKDSVPNMVRNWTQDDYQAAGTWLGATPDGPAKNLSVKAYAETVSKYEPEVAAQWAMTLPAGKEREQTLKTIQRNWPEADPDGAAAFAKEHGIKVK